MEVQSRSDNALVFKPGDPSRQDAPTGFAEALARFTQGTAGGDTPAAGTGVAKTAAEKKREAAQRDYENVLAEFRDYLKKTPIQHMREAILKEMDLSEDALKAMPPAQHNAIEAEIGRRIKERLLGKDEGSVDGEPPQPLAANGVAGSMPGLNSLLGSASADVLAQQLAAVLASEGVGANPT